MEGKRVQKPEPVAASCNGLLFWKTPGRMPGRRVLRPWKNFAGFRRFPRAETALEPGCGADLEAKRRIWNPETRCKRLQRALFGNPGPDAGKGIYVLGRISRNFDVFLAPRPPWSLGAGPVWKQKRGYETPKPAANGCNGFFGKPRAGCRKRESTSSEEFRGISTFSSRRDRPGAWVRGRFGSKKILFGKPRAGCREGNLRPRKNFAGFRRFSQTGTALWPRCRGCF